MSDHFDPMTYDDPGSSITRALDEQPVISLLDSAPFDGVGIYAFYYTGDHPAYGLLSDQNRTVPGSWALYIGKAEAESARESNPDQRGRPAGHDLYERILKHRGAINSARNLDASDFQLRALTIHPRLVPLAETVGIRLHKPVWNALLGGFGADQLGGGLSTIIQPRWDTLHNGRSSAHALSPRPESAADIQQDVIQYLASRRP